MEKLVLGFDFCDDVTKISCCGSDAMNPADISFPQADGRTTIQTAIGRKKGADGWFIGKEAYEAVLEGGGSVADKLLTLLVKNENIVLQGRSYAPQELLCTYIGMLLETVYAQTGCREIARLVFTLEKTEPLVMDSITHCMDNLGIGREAVSIINHTEAYLNFVLRQPKASFESRTMLLDWSGNRLFCYELNFIRGVSPQVIKASRELLEADLPQDGMNKESVRRMADSIINGHMERLFSHRGVSAFYVSGKPFETCRDWGRNFLSTVMNYGRIRKSIYYENNIFAKGAVIASDSALGGKMAYPYTIICEGRIGASIWVETVCRGARRSLYLARAGTNWYECRTSVDFILDDTDFIRLKIRRTGEKIIMFENINLDVFPKRPNKTTRVRLILAFTSEHTALVRVQDLGFGEFFPSSGIVVKKEIKID